MYNDTLKRFKELESELSQSGITNDPQKLIAVTREHAELKEAAALILDLKKIENQISENKEIIGNENDEEFKLMAESELDELEIKKKSLEKKIESELNPPDPSDKKNVIMEIRAGTGGDESALFAADLFRMYSRYSEKMGWKTEIYSSSRIGIGGFKEIIFSIQGKSVYKYLKHESGTHRVQRIPETEKSGRIHTSAATVAIMPEAEEVDVEIKPEDLRIDTYAASGPGGQKVNTTNSAVRVIHLPTNTTVQCQDQKSQHQNKEKALRILRSRILANVEEERTREEAAARKKQVGTGDRSEKIRTYNFPQDRVTDHRIKKSWSQIDRIMDGEIDNIISALEADL